MITRAFSLSETGVLRIGRGPDNDLVLSNPLCSRRHARIERRDGAYLLFDENSTYGTFRNGYLVAADPLSAGDRIQIGTQDLTVASAGESLVLSISEASDSDPAYQANTLFQQSVRPAGGGITVFLRTMDSRTRFLGPHGKDREAVLSEGDRLAAGGESFAVWDGGLRRVAPSGMRIDAVDLTQEFRGKQILSDVSLAVKPGEFVGFLGPSGAGKTSLLRILAGLDRPSRGSVSYDGTSLACRSARAPAGFVPQEDQLHEGLTGREIIEFSANLHAMRSLSPSDPRRKAQSILEVLDLAGCSERPVRFLSSGQRKRVSLGFEMAADPSVLALDEPTANLDPGLEAKMIELLRRISDHKRTILVSTHRLAQLQEFDRVAVIHGGLLVFYGPPPLLPDFFQCGDLARIYEKLDTRPAREWAERFHESTLWRDNVSSRLSYLQEAQAGPAPVSTCMIRNKNVLLPQTGLAAGRLVRLARREIFHWSMVLGQSPLIAGLILLVFSQSSNSWPLLFCMGISSIWFGCINSVKEICRERPLLERERRLGLRMGPYLAAKFGFLSALSILQTSALVWLVNMLVPLEGRLLFHFITFGLVGVSATAMGLLLSAGSARTERALAGLPVILIPQILFAGAVVPFDEMLQASQWLSRLTLSRWAFTAAKKITLGFAAPWDEWAALSVMAAMFIFFTILILRGKTRKWI